MDVEKILSELGAELPGDQKEKLISSINDGVMGLKSNTEKLLGEKKAISERVADAEKKAAEAEEARLKASNDMDGLNKMYKKQNEERAKKDQEQLSKIKNATKERDKANLLVDFGSEFITPSTAKFYLNSMVDIDDEGKTTFKDIDGQIVATDSKGFGEWLGTKPESIKAVLSASKASGGGAGGSGGSGGSTASGTQSQSLEDTIGEAINK